MFFADAVIVAEAAQFSTPAVEIEKKRFSAKVILTDIEGTTTSISFVKGVLFPYAKQHMRSFVLANLDNPVVIEALKEVGEGDVESIIATLLEWIDQDKKATSLKTIQGLIWEEGYQSGAFHGHLYPDAYEDLVKWNKQNIPLFVYSSGSVKAQKLLYGHTPYGDITPLFHGYFDTKIGPKKESASYVKIAYEIGVGPNDILFLSDSEEELQAARVAGMQTVMLCREGLSPSKDHPAVKSFHEIEVVNP